MKFRPQMQLRFWSEEHYDLVRAAAARDLKSVNEYILVALDAKLGVNHGYEQNRAKGGIGQDSKKASIDGGGAAKVRDGKQVAGRLRGANGREKGVRAVRSGVSGPKRQPDAGTVLGAPDGAQRESGAVGGSTQPDRGGEESAQRRVSVVDRPHFTPHAEGCGCRRCRGVV